MSATDKVKNTIDDVSGKAKEALGKATDDKSTENEGRVDQAKSDLKDAGEASGRAALFNRMPAEAPVMYARTPPRA